MKTEIKKAIITAAGFGSRFLPITKSIPKEFLPILNKPIIQYIVEECLEANIEEIIIVCDPDRFEVFNNYFFDTASGVRKLLTDQNKKDRLLELDLIEEYKHKIRIIPEDRSISYGNGRPILSAQKHLNPNEPFVVCFGDDLVLSDKSAVSQMKDFYFSTDADAVLQVTQMPREHITKGGMVLIKEGTVNQIDKIIEKPKLEDVISTLYSYGRFILPYNIFKYLNPDLKGKDSEIWLQDANDLMSKDLKVLVNVVEGKFLTTGDPTNYLNAQNEFSKKHN